MGNPNQIKNIGVDIHGVVKDYGDVVAVNNLTLKIYKS